MIAVWWCEGENNGIKRKNAHHKEIAINQLEIGIQETKSFIILIRFFVLVFATVLSGDIHSK